MLAQHVACSAQLQLTFEGESATRRSKDANSVVQHDVIVIIYTQLPCLVSLVESLAGIIQGVTAREGTHYTPPGISPC
jgi:hypothetical protein